MNKKIILFFALSLFFLKSQEIIEYKLNKNKVYSINIGSRGESILTIKFPSKITNIFGSFGFIKSEAKNKDQANFLLSWEGNFNYFSIRSLKEFGEGELNIVYKNNIYLLRLIISPKRKSQRIVSFIESSESHSGYNSYQLKSYSIIDLLKKFKNYNLLKKSGYEMKEIVVRPLAVVKSHKDFIVVYKDIKKEKSKDAIFLSLEISSKVEKELLLDFSKIYLIINGRKIVKPTLVDGATRINPRGKISLRLLLVGDGKGDLANFSIHNNFAVSLNMHQNILGVKESKNEDGSSLESIEEFQ